MTIKAPEIGLVMNGVKSPLDIISARRKNVSLIGPRIKPIMNGATGSLNWRKRYPITPKKMTTKVSNTRLLSPNAPTTHSVKMMGIKMYLGICNTFTNSRRPGNSTSNMKKFAIIIDTKMP